MTLGRLCFLSVWIFLSPCAAFAGIDPCPALSGAAAAYSAATGVAGTNCNTIVTVSQTGVLTFSYPNTNPYDGNDDNYVGMINYYPAAVTTIAFTSSTDSFNFDGDGIDGFGIPGNLRDLVEYGAGAYGGFDAYYTGVNGAATAGTVHFLGGLAAGGGTGYFSLEEVPAAGNILAGTLVLTPEPGGLALLGTGLAGTLGAVRRRRGGQTRL